MNPGTLNKLYLWGIRILVFAIPFLSVWIASSMYFPYITGRNFVFRILVAIALALWAGLIFLNKKYRPKFTPILWVILIFAAVVGLADLLGVDPFHSFWSRLERMEGYLMILHLVAYFTILTSVFRTKKDWLIFFNLIVIAGILVGGYGLLQILGLKEAIQGGGVRIDGTIGNPTYLAAYLSLVIAFSLILLFNATKKWQKYLYGAAMAYSLFIMFFTASRGAAVALLVTIPLFLILYLIFFKGVNGREAIFKKLAIGLLIFIVVAPSAIWLLRNTGFVQGNETLSRLTSLSFGERTIKARFIIWGMSWQAFLERPILGWGQENFLHAFSKYFDPRLYDQEPWFDRPHNIVFEWLLNAGILGLLSYLSLFAALYWGIIWLLKKQSIGKKEGIVLLVIPVTYFIQNFFVFDNFNTYILFFALLAYVNSLVVGQSAPQLTNGSAEEEPTGKPNTSLAIFSAALIVALLVIYAINVRPMRQAAGIISGLVATSDQIDPVNKSLDAFKKSLELNTFATAEELEQLSRATTLLLGQANIPNNMKIPFFQYTIQQLEDYLDRFPNNIRIHLMTAGLYQGARNLSPDFILSAREHMEAALALSPTKQQILFVLADNYLSAGDNAKAIELSRQAVELDQTYRDAQMNLALIGILTANGDVVLEVFNNLSELRVTAVNRKMPYGPTLEYILDLERIASMFMQVGQPANAQLIYQNVLTLEEEAIALGMPRETWDSNIGRFRDLVE